MTKARTRAVAAALVVLVGGGVVGWFALSDHEPTADSHADRDAVAAAGTNASPSLHNGSARALPSTEPISPLGATESRLAAVPSEPEKPTKPARRDTARVPTARRHPRRAGPARHRVRFDERALEPFGYPTEQIDALKGRWQRAQDEAAGWVEASADRQVESNASSDDGEAPKLTNPGVGQRAQLRREAEEALRNDLPEAEYDAVLFATGKNNRVLLSHVLPNSELARAGIGSDDEVIRFAGQRVFGIGDLKQLAAEETPGEPVELEVLRDGEILTTQVQVGRAGFGALLEAVRRPPLDDSAY